MIRRLKVLALGLVLVPFAVGDAGARIPEPDHVFHGAVSVHGAGLSAGLVTAVLGASPQPIASALLTPASGGRYVVRIPIDSVDPRDAGTARPGDPIRFFVDGKLAGESTVGERGVAQVLDLDQNFNDLLSLNDVAVTEGLSGATEAEFTLSLSEPSTVAITVQISTANGTAMSGTDYTPLALQTVTLPPGIVAAPVRVSVTGDALNEGNETFFVDVVSTGGARAGDPRGVGTIEDDDALPVLVASSVSTPEGNPGRAQVSNFAVSLSAPSGQSVQVQYATVNGTASSGSDFTAVSGALTFPPGTTTLNVPVALVPDVVYERGETFTLALSAPVNVLVDTTGGRGVILNDDPKSTDANGDGKTDIYWQNDADGLLEVWYMDGVTRTAAVPLIPAQANDPAWKVVGTADFNVDGKPDLLWRQVVNGLMSIWYMDGVTRTAAVRPSPREVPGVDWKIRATDDFNGDGQPDILWYNAATGSLLLWHMNNDKRLSAASTIPDAVPDLAWSIGGAGDFNGDQSPDILWQHADGRLLVWLMNGANQTAVVLPTPRQESDTSWRVAGLGDYNQDGKLDILWRNQVSGLVRVWFLDGTTRTGLAPLNAPTQPTTWQIVGPK